MKGENLADSDESHLGDTTEHAGEQDTDGGHTSSDPEGENGETDNQQTEEEPFPHTESATSASPGEGEGAQSVAPPESERLADREDV